MITKTSKELFTSLKNARALLKRTSSKEEKVALLNYIGNLLSSIEDVSGKKTDRRIENIFKSPQTYKIFLNETEKYDRKMIDNFVKNKKFHLDFIGYVFPNIEDHIETIGDRKRCPIKKLSKKDFYEIFYEFMKSIHVENMFDKFVREKRIFSSSSKDYRLCGYTINNPVNKDTRLFLNNFHYTLQTMFILAHEFGHAYDHQLFNKSIKDYNIFLYSSFNGEVLSRLFERLFVDFLLNNNIEKEQAKDIIAESEILNCNIMMRAYILLLLKNKYYYNRKYKELDSSKIADMVEDAFLDRKILEDFIEDTYEFDISEDLNYTYGDIISLFLKEAVDSDGLSCERMERFLSERHNLFYKDNLRRLGVTKEKYVDLHEKRIQLVKK